MAKASARALLYRRINKITKTTQEKHPATAKLSSKFTRNLIKKMKQERQITPLAGKAATKHSTRREINQSLRMLSGRKINHKYGQ